MNPKIEMHRRTREKLQHWMRRAGETRDEVSGFGTVRVDRDPDTAEVTFFVEEVYLLPQDNTGSSSDITPEGLAQLEYRVYRDAQARGAETVPELRYWWHSHVWMDAFWSGTDQRTLVQLSEPGWILATVFNLRGEQRSCFVQGPANGQVPIVVDGLDLSVVDPIDEVERAAWDADFQAHVLDRKPKPAKAKAKARTRTSAPKRKEERATRVRQREDNARLRPGRRIRLTASGEADPTWADLEPEDVPEDVLERFERSDAQSTDPERPWWDDDVEY